MPKQTYAVIGLGRFGMSIAKRLHAADQEVLGLDIDEEVVEEAEGNLTHAVVADSTDKQALDSVGIRNVDCAIVAIGDDMEASILTTLILKEVGIKKVIAKALNNNHGRVLEKIGADWIIYPERDMGERVAHQLLSPNVLNFIELSQKYSIEEIKIPTTMYGKSLRDMDLRAKFNLSAIAIVRDGDIIISPSPEQIIYGDDLLVLLGTKRDLKEFANID
ncbi:potassium channel family protein [Bacillus sp. EB01]|uniref:potassium channel family protein n=1 Tax=Bacillus sp. EB01 TaxID=1347086 RepID=UPI0005C5B995|nr:TrkA family potassium uptake protein [Bacillus sp. EB01]